MSGIKCLLGIVVFSISGIFAAHGPDVTLHPDFTLHSARPNGFDPQVAGLEIMDNGDLLVLTWRGQSGPRATGPAFDGTIVAKTGTRPKNGELFRITNAKSGDRGAMTVKKIADNFVDAHGLTVVDGEIYVGDIDRIVKLENPDANGFFRDKKEIGKLPSYDGWFEYAFGPVYKEGKFYMALALSVQFSGFDSPQIGPDRSTVVSIPLSGGKYEVVASGFRAPDGIAVGPGNEIFVTDNQGGWRPASMITNVRQGRHYGYMVNPPAKFQSEPVTPPTIWTPHGEGNESPTELILMKNGKYAGQFVYGDIGRGGIYRAFVEEVDGEFQGGMTVFSGGFEVGIHRLREGVNGEIYVGGLGVGEHRNQGWNETRFGLQRLAPKAGANKFEILTVRARKGGMTIEFSKPVGAGGEDKSRYTVQQWSYNPTAAYGGGKVDQKGRTVNKALLSPDRRKVFLEINELTAGQVVFINVGDVKAQDNDSLWYSKSWYTLNRLSEMQPFEVPVKVAENSGKAAFGPLVKVFRGFAGELQLQLPKHSGTFDVEVLRPDGKSVAAKRGLSGSVEFPKSLFHPGLHMVRIKQGKQQIVRLVAF